MKNDTEKNVDAVSDDALDSELKPDPEQILKKDTDIKNEQDSKEFEDSDSESMPGITPDDNKNDSSEASEASEASQASDITENDLGSLLDDSPEAVDGGESEEDSNLISQNDIDALLQGTEEEDEDILGDIDADAGSTRQDMDNDLNADIDDQENQVIIEEDEENDNEKKDNGESSVSAPLMDEVQSEKKENKKKPKKKWYSSKFMLAGLGTVILLLSIGAGYYFFFYGPALKAKLHNKKTNLQANSGFRGKTENVNANLLDFPQAVVPRSPGMIAMKDFIVFSQGKNKKFTYVSVDLSVHYSNDQALEEIKKHLPFYRGVIYDTIEKEISIDTKKKISEKNLSKAIKQALNQVLIKKYIDQVLLTSFKTG